MKTLKLSFFCFLSLYFLSGCSSDEEPEVNPDNYYTGTGSATQGITSATITNLFPSGQRVAGIGEITAMDNSVWTVPAQVNFTDESFPFASDLYNQYGNTYNSASDALAALDGTDIIEIDSNGEVITAYLFADNYFEMYVNGIAVGKDAVPFTGFNSHIVRFKVERPFTVAMKLVDWEEHLGIGTEAQSAAYHPGDGGMVAVFKNANENIIDVTDNSWKAQTYYIAPVQFLSCLSEDGNMRLSTDCSTEDSSDGTSFYGIHWEIPTGWATESFDDSGWPTATTFSNNIIGVDNKASYTNFTDIFDDNTQDAQFIWSTNVVLDNEVLVRKTIE